ncbi:MAG: hypothetical protein ACOWWR_18735, partial [Eubacteriales bacterium]
MRLEKQMRILVTAVGTVNGTFVVDELKKSYGCSIYVIGANCTPKEYVVVSKFVDEYFEFPLAVENKQYYLNYVLEFCTHHHVSHIICFIDEEVESFTKNRKLFEERNIKLCLPSYDTVVICHFKDMFTDWINNVL